MNAGKLRHRYDLQSWTESVAADGSVSQSWGTVAANVPVGIEPLVGRELIEAMSQKSRVSHKLRLRYENTPTVNPGQRLRLSGGTRVFHVLGVINANEASRELIAMCEEAV